MDLKEQIIYVDSKPHIKCGVVMLPTKNESSLWINCENKLKIHIKDRMCPGKQEFQYLYFTSNEEIKESDWFLADIRNHISENNGNPIWELKQCTHINNSWIFTKEVGIGFNPNWCKKIIATTDELYLSELFPVDNEIHSLTSRLPQPSQQFIEKYIEEYNKGNQIVDVLVEITDSYLEVDYISKLKLDSQNQITIRKQKDSWSRKEVTDLISDWTKMKSGLNMNLPNNFNQWIEENL